jgi:hypothetical protein
MSDGSAGPSPSRQPARIVNMQSKAARRRIPSLDEGQPHTTRSLF